MTRNRQKGIWNSRIMKGDYHYSRVSSSNFKLAQLLFLSFVPHIFFTGLTMIQSHFSGSTVCPAFLFFPGFCQIAKGLLTIPGAVLKSSICLRARARHHSGTTLPPGAQICWPRQRKTSAARFSFTSVQFTWDGKGRARCKGLGTPGQNWWTVKPLIILKWWQIPFIFKKKNLSSFTV